MTEIIEKSTYSNLATPISFENSMDAHLTDEYMANLISGVGNHASKLVLLASMQPGAIYSQSGETSAHSLLKSSQDGSHGDGWVPEYTVPFKYLADSLAPIGMVAKELIDEQKGTIGYGVTEAGSIVGVPFAGYLLDFAERHNLALSQVFGDTTSRNPNERAGGSRWRIFQGLATQEADEQVSITQLAQSVGNGIARTQNSLSELASINLLHYEAGTKRQPQTYHIDIDSLRNRLPGMYTSRSRELAQYVVDTGLSVCTVAELAELVTKDKLENNTAAFRSALKSILRNWENIGLTQRTIEKSGDALIWVTSAQQIILQDLVQILDNIQSGDNDTLKIGRAMARDIVNDPNRVVKLLAHEKEVSVHYHGQENAKKRGARVLEILHRSGTEMTYEEIRKELENMGDIVSAKGVARIIKSRNDMSVIPNESKNPYKVTVADEE